MGDNNNQGFVFKAGSTPPQQNQQGQVYRQPQQPVNPTTRQPSQQSPAQPQAAGAVRTRQGVKPVTPVTGQPQRTGGYPQRARSGGYPQGKAPAHGAAQHKAASMPQKPAHGGAPGKKKKSKLGIIIPVAVLLLAIGGLFFYGYTFFKGPQRQALSTAGNTYSAADKETLIKYLTHPSLCAGDTINVTGSVNIDMASDLGDCLECPLVSIDCSGGALTFSGGSIIMTSGRSDAVTMNGVTLDGTNVYIEAPSAALTWSGISDDANVNVKTLNGSAHTRQLSVKLVGSKLSIPVTVVNETSSALNNCVLTLYSDMFGFAGGNTVKTSIPAGGQSTVTVSATALAGGHGKIQAIATDSAGSRVAYGESAYIDIFGSGYYAGDVNVHTTASKTNYSGTTEGNVASGYANGLSFIGSVETSEFGATLSQSEIDSLVGASNAFIQVPGISIGDPNLTTLKVITYDYPADAEIPSSEYYQNLRNWYGEEPNRYAKFPVEGKDPTTYRLLGNTIDEVRANGGITLVPHPFGYDSQNLYYQYDEGQDPPYSGNYIKTEQWVGGIDIAINIMRNTSGINCFEILPSTSLNTVNDMPFKVGVTVWDNVNSTGTRKMFGVSSGNELTSDMVGSRYIKCNMPVLSEDSFFSVLRSGNYIASNGPELRFSLGGAEMGDDLYIEPAGEKMTLSLSAYDEYPLTSVKVYRCNFTYNVEQTDQEAVVDFDLTGQGVYSFTRTEEIDVQPNCYYRVEVTSEKAAMYGDIGRAFSNPIYVRDGEKEGGRNNTSVKSMTYEFGTAQQFMKLLFASSFKTALTENAAGVKYIDATGMFTPNALSVDAYGNTVSIDYHPMASETMADYVTVRVLAKDGSSTSQKLYIVEK